MVDSVRESDEIGGMPWGKKEHDGRAKKKSESGGRKGLKRRPKVGSERGMCLKVT